MAIKGYLVYNVTQENEKIFSSQIDAFIDAFKKERAKLLTVNNINAYEKISKDKDVKFILFWDKDIALMYQLENLNIKMFNNVDAIRLCDDKAYTYARLVKHKVNTPKTIVIPLTFFKKVNNYYSEILELIKKAKITFPLIVKERCSSLGLGVYLIKNAMQLKSIIKRKWQRELIIQEYISYEVGRDYRVYLINHRPKAIVTRFNKKDFRSNVEQGGKMSVVGNAEHSLLKQAMKASIALNLDFGAVDLVKDKDNRYYVLEVNSNARSATIDSLIDNNLTRSIAQYILQNI